MWGLKDSKSRTIYSRLNGNDEARENLSRRWLGVGDWRGVI